MALYDGDLGGGPVNPMAGPGALAAMIGRKRRRMSMGGPLKRKFGGGMPGGMRMGLPSPVDPGFEMQPTDPMEAAGSMLRKKLLEGGPGQQPVMQDRVRWGGQVFQDPNKLWGWIQRHGGGQGGQEKFWELHPDAARRLGVDVGDPMEEDPMNPAELKRGLIGQLTQAQGAMEALPARGITREMGGVAGRRLRAVGAAQGRAHNLAKIMAAKLRNGRGGARPVLFGPR